jgi:predicted transposase/invertase (TIGR01784 family)
MEPTQETLHFTVHTNDGFFKAMFSHPEHATSFFKSHLPPAISKRIEWPSLVVLPGSFVKSSLQQLHSDLLFSVSLGGANSLIYLLFEHQSTPDPAMPLRLLAYLSEIFTKFYKTHGLPLQPVLPFVFHQGPEAWVASPHFEDLFDLPDDLATDLIPFLPKFQHALLDLTQFDPNSEEDDSRLKIILQLMKLARQKELLRFFRWLAEFPHQDLPDDLLSQMLLYALHADSNLDAEKIYPTLTSNPELRQNTMSIAEKLIAQGHLAGLTQGISQGISQGRWVGRIQALQEFLDLPISDANTFDGLTLTELETIHEGLHHDYELRFKHKP